MTADEKQAMDDAKALRHTLYTCQERFTARLTWIVVLLAIIAAGIWFRKHS